MPDVDVDAVDPDKPILTYKEIFESLIIEQEIIIEELPAHQLQKLRRGLSNYKTKLNTKLKANNLPLIEDRALEFETINQTEEQKTRGVISVRVRFQESQSINGSIRKLTKDF